MLPRSSACTRSSAPSEAGPLPRSVSAFETALTTKTPDLSEASISSDFLIAGAGFEPATFGL